MDAPFDASIFFGRLSACGQHRRERIWKIVGDAAAMSVEEARSRAVQALAAIRRGEGPPRDPSETLFEAVAETVFERYERLWKPGTLHVNRCYLKNQILPRFRGKQIAGIDRRDVRDWFASLRATPVAADRSMPVLSVIMREAEAMGLRPRGSNPCLGIRRYRRKGRARFLSDEEIRRLSARLSAHEDASPRQAAVVRLFLLTGCRMSEILRLRWSQRSAALAKHADAVSTQTAPNGDVLLSVAVSPARVQFFERLIESTGGDGLSVPWPGKAGGFAGWIRPDGRLSRDRDINETGSPWAKMMADIHQARLYHWSLDRLQLSPDVVLPKDRPPIPESLPWDPDPRFQAILDLTCPRRLVHFEC